MTPEAVQRAAIELFSSVKPERAADAVVEQILDLIQAGRLGDQQVLPGERRLATAMGVSRHTIREAIEILQDAGVLAVETGGSGGTRVASIWMPESLVGDREPWAAETVFEALEARRVIEPRVAQLAALRGTTEDFEAIRKTIDLQRAHQSNWWQITQGNVLFHRLLWRAARNPELESAMRSIYRKLSGPLYQVLSHDQDSAATAESIDLHLETLEAVMRGDHDVVDEVMDRHLRYLERRCEAMFGRARIPSVPQFLTGSGGSDSYPDRA
jgi:GntR family transcriptional regulator, transcriptional repressor for pyruvate dehydrogenase complex